MDEFDYQALIQHVLTLANAAERSDATWANDTLPTYLAGLAGFLEDASGYYRNRGEDIRAVSPWRVIADALQAARIYE